MIFFSWVSESKKSCLVIIYESEILEQGKVVTSFLNEPIQ